MLKKTQKPPLPTTAAGVPAPRACAPGDRLLCKRRAPQAAWLPTGPQSPPKSATSDRPVRVERDTGRDASDSAGARRPPGGDAEVLVPGLGTGLRRTPALPRARGSIRQKLLCGDCHALEEQIQPDGERDSEGGRGEGWPTRERDRRRARSVLQGAHTQGRTLSWGR